jgi:hypothetical protein
MMLRLVKDRLLLFDWIESLIAPGGLLSPTNLPVLVSVLWAGLKRKVK